MHDRSLLADEGYSVQTAENGEDALRAVHAAPPDLVLADIMMPLVNGRELSDNYGYARNMTFTEAAATLRDAMARWLTEFDDRVAEVIVYQDYEQRASGMSTDREDYFGLLRIDGSDKGAYTAEARTLIRSSRPDGVPP